MPEQDSAGVERPTTVEYGVMLTLERGSAHIWAGRRLQYWSPEPTSEDEAVELAIEEYDGEVEEIRGVETREVPAPEKWGDDDPRLMTDGGQEAGGVEHEQSERFWSRYDIPFEHDTCIKVRRSGLLRGSSGTGHAADTVVHLHVQEPFTDGRLSRSEDSYLCEKDSFVGFQGREERHVEDGESYVPSVTCDTCLQRMERWKSDTTEVDPDA